MKILEVESLVTGIQATIDIIENQKEQTKVVAADLNNLISLDEAFSGNGAEAIKSFYQECHVPFLNYYHSFLVKYRRILKAIDEAYPTVESDKNGFIRESFLEGELDEGLLKVKNITIDLTNDVNRLTKTIEDIIQLPNINDDDVIKGVERTQKKIKKTVDNLNQFDEDQSKALNDVKDELKVLITYIKDLESGFKTGKISVSGFGGSEIQKMESYKNMKKEMEKQDFSAIPLPIGDDIYFNAYAPISSTGATFGTVSEAGALGEVAYKVKRYGVDIRRSNKGFVVKNGKYIGLDKGKKFDNSYISSQIKEGNGSKLKIAKHVKPSVAVTSAFKSKLGIAGIGISTGENVYKNIKSNASASKTVGDAAVDIGLGAVTIAGGAVAVTAVSAIGAPLLVVAGAGFVAATGAAYILDGIKVGKNEKTLSTGIKDGVQKGVKTVAGWFK